MSRGGGPSLDKATLAGIVVVVFLLIVVVPDVLNIAGLLSDIPSESSDASVEQIQNFVVPWWVPIALASAPVFVLMVVLLQVIGADEILEY